MTPLRARLWNPPNAVEDTGITMRNGWPVAQPVKLRLVPEPAPIVEAIAEELPPVIIAQPEPTNIWPGNLLAEFWLPQDAEEFKPFRFTVTEIKHHVCLAWDVSHAGLVGQARNLMLIKPRHVAIALSYHLTEHSTTKIGRFFGGRDHTTIVSANKKMRPHIEAVAAALNDASPISEWVMSMKQKVEERAA